MNDAFQRLLESFSLLFTGLGLVMGLLFSLYGMCYGVGLLFKRRAAQLARTTTQAKAATENKAPPAALPTLFWGNKLAVSVVDEDIPLVIATAIYRLMEANNYRVLTVKTVNPSATVWAREGRRSIFVSRHQL